MNEGKPLPLVSVIIPCHSREEPLQRCLDSVAAQTWAPVEVLVVDDASPRPLAPIVAQISWPAVFTVETIRSEVNLGPGGARELGRRRVNGDYVCYLDSDDFWAPQKLEAQVMALETAGDASMCYSTTVLFEEMPITGREGLRPRSDQRFDRLLPALLTGRPWSTTSCMWRRDAVDRIGPWAEMWTWEDHEYDCRAGCLDLEVVFVDLPLTYYSAEPRSDRLSAAPSDRLAVGKAAALLGMAKVLQDSGKTADVDIREPFEQILLSVAMQCLDEDEHALNKELLVTLRRLTPRRVVRLVTRVLPIIASVSRPLARRAGIRLRRSVLRRGINPAWAPKAED